MHPSLDQFKHMPSNMQDVTVVVCSHAYHGTYTYYFPVEDFQHNVMTWLRGAWINGFTVMIYPAAT